MGCLSIIFGWFLEAFIILSDSWFGPTPDPMVGPTPDPTRPPDTKEMLLFMKDKHKNEPFTFSIDGKNIADFLGECGHKIVRHLNQDQIETTYLKKADGSSIGKPNGLFNMIITSPEV